MAHGVLTYLELGCLTEHGNNVELGATERHALSGHCKKRMNQSHTDLNEPLTLFHALGLNARCVSGHHHSLAL